MTASQFFRTWNKKLHIYLGLYLTVFLWFFAVSGLLLNHFGWRFAEFWPQRKQSSSEHPIQPPAGQSDLERARDILGQLGIAGEIEWTQAPADENRFEFRAVRPGRNLEIKVDLSKRIATVNQTRINTWGIMRVMHTFTGAQSYGVRSERDWYLTRIWSFSMDAVAIGVIFLAFSSLVMAFQRLDKRVGSCVALALGIAVCGFFLFGLRWM